jgi:diketogulonate reductase-like aldo/keto reductase
MQAMGFLIDNNLTRFIGVSNFSVEQIEDAQDCSENRIVANQIEYNLLTRNKGKFTSNMESEMIPYCQKKGILPIAFSPLAEGKLAQPGMKILDEMATKYGKTQAQIALNWLITKPNIVTIPKAVRIERIKEDLDAIGWRLSKEDMYKLDACSQS